MSAGNNELPTEQSAATAAVRRAFGLPLPTFVPQRYKPKNVGEWSGHLAFASDLIRELNPSLIVELGTHYGEAYFTFCQTVQESRLSSVCYAVDHWMGDEHAGHYGEEVFENVRQYNERYYRQFSYLLRLSFDEALPQFSDSSIGLLHIDGLHTYEAAAHDFRIWLPKVKDGGIVLLHDICPKHEDFGVWRLWDEIKGEFPFTFEFHHSWGLGVVLKSDQPPSSPLLNALFNGSECVREEVRHRYVVYASHLENLLGPAVQAAEAADVRASTEVRVQVFPWGATGYSEDTSLLRKTQSGVWDTLSFELPEDSRQGPLRIDPAHETGLIEIRDLALYSRDSGELAWSAPSSSQELGVQIAGTARLIPNPASLLLLMSFGDDPQLILTIPTTLQGPLTLRFSLRVTPTASTAPEILDELFNSQAQHAGELLRTTEQAKAEKEQANAQTNQAVAERDQANAEKRQANAEAQRANEEKRLAQERAELAENQLRQEQMVRLAMQESRSWKLTAPMRKLVSALRPNPRTPR